MTDSLYEYSMPRGADQQLTYDIYVADSQKPFSIVCRLAAGALDDDNLTVHNIHIATSRADLGNFALKLLGLFFLIDAVALLYIKREAIGNLSEEQRHVIVGLLAATFVLSLPYLSGFIYMQRDITFHMARIEGLKNGLLSGAFPVRIQPSWANSHGYAVSVFYGDLFLYPSALLRLAGIPMGFCYSFYVICVNFATLLIGYFCFKKMTNSTYIGLAVALVYAANIYRLMALNIRAAVGEYTAMAFFPLILSGFWAIYTPPPQGLAADKWQSYKKLWFPLAIGCTGVIQSHAISTMLVGIVTVIVCLIMWKQTFKKETFFVLLKTLAFSILVNLWFLLPFLDYMRYEWVGNSYEEKHLQWFIESAVYLPQLFFTDFAATVTRTNEMPFALGTTILLVLLSSFLFKGTATKQEKNREIFCWVAIALLIIATSTLCPWERMARVFPPLGFFARTMQVTWRFNTLTALFAIWLLCLTANKLKGARQKCVIIGIVAIGMLQALDFSSKILVERGHYFVSEVGDYRLDNILLAEYVPANANLDDYVNALTPGEWSEIHDSSREYNRITVSATNYSNGSDFIEVPLINYPGYRAVDLDTGARLAVSDGASKRVKVEIPGGYSGSFVVRFVSPWYWRLAEAVSVLTVVVLVAGNFRGKFVRRKDVD
jgi:hypothetical protein